MGTEDGRVFYCNRNRPVPETVEEDSANIVPFLEGGRILVAMGGRPEYNVYEAALLKIGRGSIVCELGQELRTRNI
jgi:hypothetical protein